MFELKHACVLVVRVQQVLAKKGSKENKFAYILHKVHSFSFQFVPLKFGSLLTLKYICILNVNNVCGMNKTMKGFFLHAVRIKF